MSGQEIPEPQRRDIPEHLKLKNSGGLSMNVVRLDVKQSLARAPDATVREAVNNGLVDNVLEKTECSVWRKFDVMRSEGAFKKKVVFFTLDGSSIVEGFLKKIFGDRPAGCLQ